MTGGIYAAIGLAAFAAVSSSVLMTGPASDDPGRPQPVAAILDRNGSEPGGKNRRIDLAQATLPGGASSLSEAFQDWLMNCSVQGDVRRCVMTQTQTQQNNSQRVLTVEIAPAAGDTATGTLVLPFGLLLEAGVALRIDAGQPLGTPLRFHTCLPDGCVVQLSFDAATVASLRGGTALQIQGVVATDKSEAKLSVSLRGFGAALDRINALTAKE